MAVATTIARLSHMQAFYGHLNNLLDAQGGTMSLEAITSGSVPLRGVYFFFEPTEHRNESGAGLRVVRVGTHGLKAGAVSTLYGRLRQHRGKLDGGGNHRSSIFRLLAGDALMRSGEVGDCATWGSNGGASHTGSRSQAIDDGEALVERVVSEQMATMRVACINIGDDPGPDSQRGWIERNVIALLSNDGKQPLDAPSSEWLGNHSSRPRVRQSGLWNQNHVDDDYDPSFLTDLERHIRAACSALERCGAGTMPATFALSRFT